MSCTSHRRRGAVVTCAFIRYATTALAALLAGTGSGVARADNGDPPEPAQAQLIRVDTPNVATRSLPGFRTDLTELSYRRWASA